jgi:hypothetical protein
VCAYLLLYVPDGLSQPTRQPRPPVPPPLLLQPPSHHPRATTHPPRTTSPPQPTPPTQTMMMKNTPPPPKPEHTQNTQQHVFKRQPPYTSGKHESPQLQGDQGHALHPPQVHRRRTRLQDRQVHHGQHHQGLPRHPRTHQPQRRPDPPQRPRIRTHRRQQGPREQPRPGKLPPQDHPLPPPSPPRAQTHQRRPSRQIPRRHEESLRKTSRRRRPGEAGETHPHRRGDRGQHRCGEGSTQAGVRQVPRTLQDLREAEQLNPLIL